MRPQSPIDIFCRGCAADPGEKCGVVPDRSLLRRRIRAGDPVTHFYVRLIPYFHQMRWRDFNRVRSDYARLDAWQKRHAEAS
jgi:hypothetical protein